MSGTCSLFPPFGDPWPSCLLPSQNLMCTRTQEKGAVTPQETDPDIRGSVQETPAEAWVGGGLLQGWGH